MHVLEKIDGVAKILGMSPSLVKKYYLLFEEKGYKFKRSNEGQPNKTNEVGSHMYSSFFSRPLDWFR